jgi:hypothetical protein
MVIPLYRIAGGDLAASSGACPPLDRPRAVSKRAARVQARLGGAEGDARDGGEEQGSATGGFGRLDSH